MPGFVLAPHTRYPSCALALTLKLVICLSALPTLLCLLLNFLALRDHFEDSVKAFCICQFCWRLEIVRSVAARETLSCHYLPAIPASFLLAFELTIFRRNASIRFALRDRLGRSIVIVLYSESYAQFSVPIGVSFWSSFPVGLADCVMGLFLKPRTFREISSRLVFAAMRLSFVLAAGRCRACLAVTRNCASRRI